MARLAPSILSADFANLGEDIKAVDLAGADIIHVDVMDGLFVPSISFGMPVIKSIRKVTEKPFDVHLMINDPIRYIDDFVEAGADWITIHVEACEDVKATLKKIKDAGVRPAISLNPGTDVEEIIPYLEMVEMVLVMSVNPGFGGQKLIPETLEKVRKLRKLIDERALRCDIEIDGGINLDNVEGIVKDGADIIVAGSAVFKDPAVNTRAFLEKISGR